MLTMNKSYMGASFKAVSRSTGYEALNPFDLSDEQIRKQIYETHCRSDDSFDADSLFIVVANILKRSTQIVDEVIQCNIKVPLEKIELEINPKAGFSVPMCILKKIGYELLSCKAPCVEAAHETTLAILEKLRCYSWEAKAVLTLAAFAKEFGDLLHHVQLDQSNCQDQLTKSLAILKGTCILSKTPDCCQKRKIAVVELNNLIKATLKVIETIFELEKLSIYGPKSIAELPIAVDVYWIIMTVIACANTVTILTNEEIKPHNLSPYDKKIHSILSLLTAQLTHFRLMKEDEDHYYKLLKLSKIPNEVLEFLKLLFFAQDCCHVHLIDGSNNYKKVEINVLRRKKVLFVISRPDISDADINILRRIYCEKIKRGNNEDCYAIVWVPIADEMWPHEHKTLVKKDFEGWLRSKEIQWYSVSKLVSHKVGLRFLKEEWHFEANPVAVVLNVAVGKVENRNAIYTLRLWGADAFPFDEETERRVFCEMNWLYTFFKDFPHQYGKLSNWIIKEKYVFFYGGMDKKWAKEIEEKINFISKNLNIMIKLFNIEEKVEIKNRFWSGIDSIILTTLHKEEFYFAKQQVKRLSSFKCTQGWFALNKGSTTVVVGSRSTFLKVVEDFHIWKVNVHQRTLEVAFTEYHEKIFKSRNLANCGCSTTTIQKRLDDCYVIQNSLNSAKELPEKLNCPVCDQVMEITVTYKCYHASKNDVPGRDHASKVAVLRYDHTSKDDVLHCDCDSKKDVLRCSHVSKEDVLRCYHVPKEDVLHCDCASTKDVLRCDCASKDDALLWDHLSKEDALRCYHASKKDVLHCHHASKDDVLRCDCASAKIDVLHCDCAFKDDALCCDHVSKEDLLRCYHTCKKDVLCCDHASKDEVLRCNCASKKDGLCCNHASKDNVVCCDHASGKDVLRCDHASKDDILHCYHGCKDDILRC